MSKILKMGPKIHTQKVPEWDPILPCSSFVSFVLGTPTRKFPTKILGFASYNPEQMQHSAAEHNRAERGARGQKLIPQAIKWARHKCPAFGPISLRRKLGFIFRSVTNSGANVTNLRTRRAISATGRHLRFRAHPW
jgi:hypothetical protein